MLTMSSFASRSNMSSTIARDTVSTRKRPTNVLEPMSRRYVNRELRWAPRALLELCSWLITTLLVCAPTTKAESLLLTGAIVHTVSGDTLAPGQVLIRDGKIAAVGATVAGGDVPILDLKGQHLYP